MVFEEVYRKYNKLVFNLVLQYVQNQEDAQEITQDVFVKIYQALPDFKHESTVSTWIYRISINTSLDFIKSRKRKKRRAILTSFFHTDNNEIRHEAGHFDHPGVELEQKEATQLIFKAINCLPDKQKTALILSKIEDKPQAEIARIMDLSTKAVESLIQRAKSNLVQNLDSREG
ncbi:MAG: RNA polymerase sigma factor [Bacteroidota bacterium]